MDKKIILSICAILAFSPIYAEAKAPTSRHDYKAISSRFLDRIYVGAKAGYSDPVKLDFSPGDIKNFDSSAVYGGMIGYRFNKWFRSDIELNYRSKSNADRDLVSGSSVESHSTKISSTLLMVNGYLMLPQMHAQPFLTAGIGLASNSMQDYRVDGYSIWPGKRKNSFAYQAGGGLTFSHENIDVDGTIQFINRGEAKTKTAPTSATPSDGVPRKVDVKDFVFSLSLRYNL